MAKREVESWITVNGVHIPIYKGETKNEAVRRGIKERNNYLREKFSKKDTLEATKHYSDDDKYPKDEKGNIVYEDKVERIGDKDYRWRHYKDENGIRRYEIIHPNGRVTHLDDHHELANELEEIRREQESKDEVAYKGTGKIVDNEIKKNSPPYMSRSQKSLDTHMRKLAGQPYKETDKYVQYEINEINQYFGGKGPLDTVKEKIESFTGKGNVKIERDYSDRKSWSSYNIYQDGNLIGKYRVSYSKTNKGTLTVYKKK